jgi:uncharacterized protein (DUF305 family)
MYQLTITISRLFGLTLAAGWLSTAAVAAAPIIQPGKPGEESREITATEAIQLTGVRYSAADVQFMSDMIPHHQQALDMTVLVADRTARNEMIELARRIESSQKDEIGYMIEWLSARGEPVPERDWRAHAHHHHHHTMEGMASEEEMAELEGATGDAFDTLFLELMIEHHRGALVMVEDLLEERGAAQDPELFEFARDVMNDQEAEIDRMTVMLASYSPDPRVGLAAGFRDAGQAIHNMELLVSLPKPDGFFDPDNPAALPTSRLRELQAEANGEELEEDESPDRPSLLDFANTDMAFADNLLAVGNYHGFKLYDIADNRDPELVSAVVCPGGQGDVSIVGDLLILSVEQFRGRVDCGLLGVAGQASDDRFRGLRIFDISNPARPRQVGQVQTCRGSHTHTVVAGPEPDGRLIVYNSGTAPVREEEEMEGCIDEDPYRDERTALFRIDVIEIPVDRPQDSRIVHSPAVFADPDSGILAGLWEHGDHGPGTQTSAETNHCHDITVFPDKQIAAGACSGNGILFDISDPINPERIHEVIDPGFAYWHSATFSNDGSKVIFTDEWGGGTRPRCRAFDPLTWGANAIYEIIDNELVFRSYYKMPAPQTEQENCVAHNGALVPVPGRDIMVQAWYQGGISVFDFTDASNPFEMAYFDRGPIDEKVLVGGGYWSAYWYRGRIYGSEIARGLDVLELLPSEHISANELAAARLVNKGDAFNPQQQNLVSWPAEPVVALARLDQLERGKRLTEEDLADIRRLLKEADEALANGRHAEQLRETLRRVASELADSARDHDGITRQRLAAVADTLEGIAQRLN